MTARTRWALIGRGFAGWHAVNADASVRSSGGDIADGIWYGKPNPGYLSDAISGALVYDASGAEDNEESARAFIRLVIGGPMVTPEIPRGSRDRFVSGKDGCLDSIGAEDFADLLRAIPGVKIGRVVNGSVTWE